jgi:hypothetical protein
MWDLIVYDQTQGRYLTPVWETVTVDSAGTFSVSVPGTQCGDKVEALAYDSGWNSYTNNGNWQTAIMGCNPN